jgi:hypothetical protein
MRQAHPASMFVVQSVFSALSGHRRCGQRAHDGRDGAKEAFLRSVSVIGGYSLDKLARSSADDCPTVAGSGIEDELERMNTVS